MAERARADALRLNEQNATLRIVAITAANINDETRALADNIAADKRLDEMNLASELLPTILRLAGRD